MKYVKLGTTKILDEPKKWLKDYDSKASHKL